MPDDLRKYLKQKQTAKQDNVAVRPQLKPLNMPKENSLLGQLGYNGARDQGVISVPKEKSLREKSLNFLDKVDRKDDNVVTGLVTQPLKAGLRLMRPDKYFDGVRLPSDIPGALGALGMDALSGLPVLAGAAAAVKPASVMLTANTIGRINHPLAKLLPEAIASDVLPTYTQAAGIGLINRTANVVSKAPILKNIYKDAAYKISTMHSGPSRTLKDITDMLFRGKKGVYDGSTGVGIAADGERNLLRNYIYGDARGFEPSDLPTTGLEKYHQKYPDMKKYKMKTTNYHGSEVVKESELGPILQSYIEQNKLEGTSIGKRIFDKRDYAGALKRLTSNNKTIGVGMEYSPIYATDNIAGHMNFISRDGVGGYKLKSQDIWKFTPEDYNSKWHMSSQLDSYEKGLKKVAALEKSAYKATPKQTKFKLEQYIKPKLAGLMDKAGKPVILLDERPIKTYSVKERADIEQKIMREAAEMEGIDYDGARDLATFRDEVGIPRRRVSDEAEGKDAFLRAASSLGETKPLSWYVKPK